MSNPCYNCPKRYPGCHGSCKDYIDWKAEHDRLRESERKRQSACPQSPKPRFRKPYQAKKIRGAQ